MVTASEMGKKGGGAKSEAKTAAARKNASKPRGKWVTAIAYELGGVAVHMAFGAAIVAGKPPSDAALHHEWVSKKLLEECHWLRKVDGFEFLELATSSMRV